MLIYRDMTALNQDEVEQSYNFIATLPANLKLNSF